MVREEIKNSAPKTPNSTNLRFNARGNFSNTIRTTDGVVICFKCKQMGHYMPGFALNITLKLIIIVIAVLDQIAGIIKMLKLKE